MPNVHRLASSASGTRHAQPTAFLLNATTLDTGSRSGGVLHTHCMATTEEKTAPAVELECPRQFRKCYSTVYLVAKVIKLITAKIVKNLMVKLCL